VNNFAPHPRNLRFADDRAFGDWPKIFHSQVDRDNTAPLRGDLLKCIGEKQRMGDSRIDQRGNDTAMHDSRWLAKVVAIADPRLRPAGLHIEDFEPDEIEEGEGLCHLQAVFFR